MSEEFAKQILPVKIMKDYNLFGSNGTPRTTKNPYGFFLCLKKTTTVCDCLTSEEFAEQILPVDIMYIDYKANSSC